MTSIYDRTYWRAQPDKRLVEAVLRDGITDPELCIALAEALDDAPDLYGTDDATQREIEALENRVEILESELAEALATIEAQQEEIYKWEQANGYD